MATDLDVNTRPNYEETTSNKTLRKMKENPMVPLGMVGFFVAVGYGIHQFKNRPKSMTANMYIMRFRVFAQSIAVGAMGLGIGYSILKDIYIKKFGDQLEETKK